MQHPVKGVDHVFIMVDDLDDSRARFERLGFTVSPRGLHSAAKGSANHTIMFQKDYLELLGLIAATPGNADRRAQLAREGQGLHAVACRIDDARAAGEALTALGIGTEGLGDFSRPLPLPEGGEGVAAFSTLKFSPGEAPQGLCFMCQHKTRDMVWLPALMRHANGAVALHRITAQAADPEAAARGFARLFAAGRAEAAEGGWRVETGADSAGMLFLTPAALAARYPGLDVTATPKAAFAGLAIRVDDIGKPKAALDAAGIAFVETEDGVAIDPAEASGTVLEFVG